MHIARSLQGRSSGSTTCVARAASCPTAQRAACFFPELRETEVNSAGPASTEMGSLRGGRRWQRRRIARGQYDDDLTQLTDAFD